jgi:hypothetical protein
MAIWQYLLIVVPEKSIEVDYQCIFKNNKTEYLPETESYWIHFDGDVSSIISKMDQIITRASWGDETCMCWKSDVNNEDNDSSICLNDDNITNFLIPILEICQANKLVLIDLKGEIHKPKIENLVTSIKASNATAFLTDPIKYLGGL